MRGMVGQTLIKTTPRNGAKVGRGRGGKEGCRGMSGTGPSMFGDIFEFIFVQFRVHERSITWIMNIPDGEVCGGSVALFCLCWWKARWSVAAVNVKWSGAVPGLGREEGGEVARGSHGARGNAAAHTLAHAHTYTHGHATTHTHAHTHAHTQP